MCYSKQDGTYDLFGKNSNLWQYTLKNMKNTCKLFNYKYIRTPIFESTDLYNNLIGKNTDVISKEIYSFKDRDNSNVSLRPEGTTGVIRSYLENEFFNKEKISKFYYSGPMFRYEKIEHGRFREFYQFGVEVFNSNNYLIDVEIIDLALSILNNLGLKDAKVFINNLGSIHDKTNFENDLRKYFKPYLNDLCNDCKIRFKENPIRILDCKTDKRKDFVINSPKIEEYINSNSKRRFAKILNELDKLNIDYEVNKNLVRGLNYYTDTVFEIKTNIEGNGSANTMCGGGRYNSLVDNDKDIIPGMGFAIGLERLIYILEQKALINHVENMIDFNILFNNYKFIKSIRELGFIVDNNSSSKSKYSIKKFNDKYLLIDNIKNKTYTLSKNKLLKKISSIKL